MVRFHEEMLLIFWIRQVDPVDVGHRSDEGDLVQLLLEVGFIVSL